MNTIAQTSRRDFLKTTAIASGGSVRISDCDDHAVGYRIVRKEPPLSDRRFTGPVRPTVAGSTK